MRYVVINTVAGTGSTGKIAADQCRDFMRKGHECVLAYGRQQHNCEDISLYRIGTELDCYVHGMYTRLLDKHGFGSVSATKKFLRWLDDYEPEVIWMHNLHGYYLNVDLLFTWLKEHPTIECHWMLHDCWSFTGHCTHFSAVGCNQWQTECVSCKQLDRYPKTSLFSNVKKNYEKKRCAFSGVNNLILHVPSHWLQGVVKQSFLKDYPIEVQHHKVDCSVFFPQSSNLREQLNLEDKIVLLAVANVWDDRKGLFDLFEISKRLDDSFQLIIVGLSEKQQADIPTGIIGITHTNDLKQLAQYYTMADLLVNPSKEETFGMTIAEAASCGTPAIVYKGTACEEVAALNNGIVVEQNVDALYNEIVNWYRKNIPVA